MARRTSSSNGASGMSRLPFTPPLFLMAVRMSPSVSSLQRQGQVWFALCPVGVLAEPCQ